MGKRFLSALALALVFGLPIAMTSGVPASAASFPLTCQIGAPNTLALANGVGLVTFNASNGPVAKGLQPGQCAWADRAVASTEPHELCFPTTIYAMGIQTGTLLGGTFTGPGAALAEAAAFGKPKLMTFMVHSANTAIGACLSIDSYGP